MAGTIEKSRDGAATTVRAKRGKSAATLNHRTVVGRNRRARINDLRQVAESTLTAIMGRMAAYTGGEIEWEQALNSQQTLLPDRLTWDTRIPMPDVATPGVTRLT